MLYDGYRAEVTECSEDEKEETGIKIISEMMSKSRPDQLADCWRQIAPCIGVSDRLER